MPKFLVKSNILMGGKLYEAGSKIELSEEQAAEMPWAIEPAAPQKEEKQTPPAKAKFVARKDFQFRSEPVKAGDVLELTDEEATKLGPERVEASPPEPEQPKQ